MSRTSSVFKVLKKLSEGEGLSTPDILRCLKRYIAREVFKILNAPKPASVSESRLKKAA